MEDLCVLYASKHHLSVILLEYLKNENTNKNEIKLYLENEIEKEIKDIENISNYKVDNINYKNKQDITKEKLKSNMTLIIEGTIQHLNKVSNYIEKMYEKNKLENITIIKCLDFNKHKESLNNVIKKGTKILCTTGKKQLTN